MHDDEREALWSEIKQLRQEIAELKQQTDNHPHLTESSSENPDESAVSAKTPRQDTVSTWTRRGLIVGGAGALAAGLQAVQASPAQAGVVAMSTGINNNAQESATSMTSSNGSYTFYVLNSSTGIALHGSATSNTGVRGSSESGNGVFGSSFSSRAGHFQSNTGPAIRLATNGRATKPTSDSWSTGDIVAASSGELWYCVSGGTPGTWRMLTSPSAAGSFVPITPVRAYDSRSAQPDGNSILRSGTNRLVDIGVARTIDTGAGISRYLPAGAKAIAANVTITQTTNRGFLSIVPGITPSYSTSAINWQESNVTLANGLTLTADVTGQVRVFAVGGDTHFIIDVYGYFAP